MARFTHIYQRPSGPIERTVYADGDRVMVEFAGERPYVLHACWTARDAEERVTAHLARIVESDHAWALRVEANRAEPAAKAVAR